MKREMKPLAPPEWVTQATFGRAAEPSGGFTPGQHLQAIHRAFFNGGGWVEPLTWDDYDADGRAQWEAFAANIAANIRGAVAAPDLLTALTAMVDAECEYMRLNNLGDPEKQHNVKRARAAIAKALGPSDLAAQPTTAEGGDGEA